MPKIYWHSFLEDCTKITNHEIVGWLLAKNVYQPNEEWHIYRVKEIPMDWDGDGFAEGWNPDKKDLARIRRIAKKDNLIQLGNVHTHPITKEWIDHGYVADIEEASHPSETDLYFCHKFTDIVRGIVVVAEDGIKRIRFHDPFDNEVKIPISMDK